MTDYKEKLGSFADRLKQSNLTTSVPIQEVRPVENNGSKKKKRDELIIRTTIHLRESLHQKVKLYCVKNKISFKDLVTEFVEKGMKELA